MNENQETNSVDNLQVQKTIKGRWITGQSGNPSGRRSGSRNKASLVAQALLVGEVNAVTNKLIELAKGGDIQAIRIIFDKLLPNPRDRAVKVEMGPLHSSKDLVAAMFEVVETMARGEITPAEAASMCSVLERVKLPVENFEFEERIGKLEVYVEKRTKG